MSLWSITRIIEIWANFAHLVTDDVIHKQTFQLEPQ